MTTKEQWKWIPGYENQYQASTLGRIKSFKTKKIEGQIMKGNTLKDGRIRVNLNGTKQLVHRLILKTFNPEGETNDKCLVLHLDGNPANNILDNLAWGSYTDNAQDDLMFKRCAETKKRTEIQRKEEQNVIIEGEEWRDIAGYKGEYQISSKGRVRSLKKTKPHIMSLLLGRTQDYYTVGLSKQGIKKRYSVNRLVAEAFIPNPEHLPEVNHKDENTLNNNVENLEWVTHSQNIRHSAHRQSYPVAQYSLDEELINIFPSLAEAERQTKIPRPNISASIRRGTYYAGGYIWRYI